MCQTTSQSPSTEQPTLSAAARAQVPTHPAAQEALKVALASLPPSVFNHSLRVYIYAQAILNSPATNLPGSHEAFKPIPLEPHVLFVACMYHDLSTIEKYDDNPKRFEIVAGDEAVALLLRHGESEAVAREAWLAMALHTTPGIPENLGGAVQAVKLAIAAEFGTFELPEDGLSEEQWRVLREDLPRLDIIKDLSEAVVRQALAREEKAPRMSWAGELLRWKKANPDHQGPNEAF